MKRCSTCNRTFSDPNLSFCIDDGTPLVAVETEPDEATVVRSSAGSSSAATAGSSSSSSSSERDSVPPYQPPGSYVPPGIPNGPQRKRRAWPWVVGVLAIMLLAVAGLVIAVALFIPKMMGTATNNNAANYNANVERRGNSNSNSNGSNSNTKAENESVNDNSASETSSPPTDEAEVLSDLTDLEHEWTVANINADKKKLDRILADDYVGITDGRSQGKADYLKTIERDTTIEKWDFEDLKANLKGDRTTLTGTIRLVVQGQDVAYRFTDKFVWRDGRWQATGSEVTPLK